jgi:adenylate cyclase
MVVLSCVLGMVCGVPGRPFWGFGLLIIFGMAWVVYTTGQFLSHGTMWDVVRPMASLTLTQLSVFSFTFLVMDRDKRFLRDTFGTYISPELIEQMVEDKEEPKLGGDEAVHTAFFTDVQDFSTISEQLTATDLVELLNIYLTDMTTILLNNQGTLDKYIGDAIVAFFGAPVPLDDHALRACKTALEIQERLELLRGKWIDDGDRWPEIVRTMQNRIGIHSGPMVTGNMGSDQRMNYTMMGDAVNLAARLESSCRYYGIYTQITEDTYSAVKERVVVREMDRIIVLGKKEPVTTYELVSLKGEQPDHMDELLPGFAEALSLYRDREWARARDLFESLEAHERMVPGRKTNPCRVYAERCEQYKNDPPPEDWGGVTALTAK